ncbi:pilus assembly protein PilM [Anaerosporobacter faecicola]|uniref:pilus assembly protein PilM n=1 Tax=Anaerosporobacter faecicola TaxID=2718714 RepID=UPI00143A9706|nr:pilus assembly protein PilM [Anaerosporobacter faecicola]
MAIKKVLSIEIGITFTRVCEMDYHSKSPKVYRSITFATPENTVEDGFIRNKEQFVQCLREELEKENIHEKHVVFTVSSTKITSREVTIPYVKENRIQSVVQANITEYFPMNLEDYMVTYQILEKKNTQPERNIRLLVMAAPNNLIKNYYNVAELLGLTIVALDYIGNSTFQIVKKQTAAGVQMVLHMNEQSSIIYILEDSILLLQRTIPYGIENLLELIVENTCFSATTIAEALHLLQKEHVLNGKLNQEIDLSETAATYVGSEELYRKQMQELHAKEEATNALGYLINNVIRVQEYCLAKFKEKRIHTIYITGIGSGVRGMHKLISNETGIDVKRIDRLIGVNFLEGKMVEEGMYLSSIGAAMSPLDFVPKDVQAEKDRKSLQNSIAFVVLIGLISIIFVGSSFINYLHSKTTLEELQEQIIKLSEIEKLNAKYMTAMQQTQALEELYQKLPTKNKNLVSVIEQLEMCLPKHVVITALTSSDEGLGLGVTASKKEEIAKLLIDLQKFEEIDSVLVGTILEEEKENGLKTLTTTLTCTYSNDLLEQ